MSANPLVIIHGWSDNAESFRPLATLISQRLKIDVKLIDLADYMSMDDLITFDDLVTAMMRAWRQLNLPENPRSVDVLVHSTGGLIIRHWLTKYFTADKAPIYRLLMLAPANFGSPLAHKGYAFIGRVLKGFESDKMFNVGKQLLKGLELASPYTWQLAMQDRFNKTENFYDFNKILCTVLVGNTGYSGISAAANEVGSDGTVRVSTANMNCGFLNINFLENPLRPHYEYSDSTGITAFGVIDGENHSTIANKSGGFKNPNTLELIIRALTLNDNNFSDWCQSLNDLTQNTMQVGTNNPYKYGYQNTVTYVQDQFQNNPEDYFLEFYTEDNREDLTQKIYNDVIKKAHVYEDNNAYRSLYVDCTTLSQYLTQNWQPINFSLTAYPELFIKGNQVGYQTFTDQTIGALTLTKDDVLRWFVENRTLLVRILIRREQAADVFKIMHL